MGPLSGYKIVEMGGIGPGPMCAMLLADLGADIVRIDRLSDPGLGSMPSSRNSLLMRSRRSIAVDTKSEAGREVVLKLIEQADGLIEGFRPGVMERMGLGPEEALKRNPKLVYGRMTGWGQDGPMAQAAGHDINYIALSGVLHAIGRKDEAPVPPLNLVGDFGGGALYLALGLVCGILEAQKSGKGQVVDTAMVDGAASLMTMFFGLMAAGNWKDERGVNILDTGTHYYDVYETSDGKYISLGSIEKKFYQELLERTGLDKEDLPPQMDPKSWPVIKARLTEVFKTKTRDEWDEVMLGTDVCYAPVLSIMEATEHPHNTHRKTFVEYDGIVQPAPAPRFSRTEAAIQSPPCLPGEHTVEAMRDWGIADDTIDELQRAGVIK
ncbi:CaiB/BaiF CoA-transferase family protein [Sneathiella sp.]|uniref:CaiB/BaiF CoA transferase family protein n=1 Tax=Sneathiella sp. TaxID=1964365 RepID=UPI002624FFE6|nr:CaiB/BaiF CoA-transferase family protein [Sneathiella sp.]MDF2366172.1 CaiB/BaiF CoA-transferase family protein [Sneathiella sp.]